MRKKLFQIFSQNSITILILIGTVIWSLTMVKSGWVYSYGMGFWGPNGHDGVWHIALAESLARGSLEMPIFAGQRLQNYHLGFDLLLALTHKLTGIRIDTLYFQIIPPILGLIIGLLTYKFVKLWTRSKKAAFWSIFFIYFGGSWGWLVTLIREGQIDGESMFWSQQAISTLINPPFALSLVVILSALIFFLKYTRSFKSRYLILAVLFFGFLGQVKVYAAILVLLALSSSLLWQLLKDKSLSLHSNILFRLTSGSLILFIVSTLPFVRGSFSALLVYQPFWFLETMMGFTDRLGWLKFYSAMTTYKTGGVWLKGFVAYLVAFLIFWYGNIGTRLVKEVLVFKWIKNYKKLGWLEIFMASVVVAGAVIPLFFLQKGTPWNTIQFFYYSLFFSGLLAGVAMLELLDKVKKSIVLHSAILLSVVVFTLPTTVGTLRHYLPSRPPAMVSKEELTALNFLKNQPNGIVLTYPFDEQKAKEAEGNPPRPLYLYESTAYVSAFSQKPTFLEDEVNLVITGYDWQGRRKEAEEFYASSDANRARNFLKENKIAYIYLVQDQKVSSEEELKLNGIFRNRQVRIFKVE